MDEYVKILRQRFVKKYGHHHDIPKFQWQKSFHDHSIRDDRDMENHLKYTVYNFLKHEYPDDWKWTSLNFPELVDEM